MAAGLGFKTFVTGEVLTAADTNGYLMQGVNVFASAAARTAAITSPQEGQMSYLKDTDSTEYYSGSAWTAVGAGGMTLLSTTAASGSTVTISSISQNYKDLIIITQGLNNASAWSTEVRLNATTVFNGVYLASNGTTYTNGRSTSYIDLSPLIAFGASNAENAHCIVVKNYANTSYYKAVQYFGRNFNNSGAAAMVNGGGAMITASALTSISVVASAGTFTAGQILIYGAN